MFLFLAGFYTACAFFLALLGWQQYTLFKRNEEMKWVDHPELRETICLHGYPIQISWKKVYTVFDVRGEVREAVGTSRTIGEAKLLAKIYAARLEQKAEQEENVLSKMNWTL